MLTDPLPIKRLAFAAHAAITVAFTDSWPRIDAGDGSAKYVLNAGITLGGVASNGPAKLRIAHSKSNEQRPVLTSRTLIRIDVPVMGHDGKAYSAYAYAVIGMPDITLVDPTDGVTLTPASAIARGLAEYLVGALAVSSTSAALDETKIDRILAGES